MLVCVCVVGAMLCSAMPQCMHVVVMYWRCVRVYLSDTQCFSKFCFDSFRGHGVSIAVCAYGFSRAAGFVSTQAHAYATHSHTYKRVSRSHMQRNDAASTSKRKSINTRIPEHWLLYVAVLCAHMRVYVSSCNCSIRHHLYTVYTRTLCIQLVFCLLFFCFVIVCGLHCFRIGLLAPFTLR